MNLNELSGSLADRGFRVRSHDTLTAGLRSLADNEPRVVVLFVPALDSSGVMSISMFQAVSRVPIVVVTVGGAEEMARLKDMGVRDRLTYPIEPTRLAAEVGRVARRATERDDVLSVGGIRVDLRGRVASLDGRALSLSRREFDLLAYLSARPGDVVTHGDLARTVWKGGRYSRDALAVYVSWLRGKLGENGGSPRYLHTLRGRGITLLGPSEDR